MLSDIHADVMSTHSDGSATILSDLLIVDLSLITLPFVSCNNTKERRGRMEGKKWRTKFALTQCILLLHIYIFQHFPVWLSRPNLLFFWVFYNTIQPAACANLLLAQHCLTLCVNPFALTCGRIEIVSNTVFAPQPLFSHCRYLFFVLFFLLWNNSQWTTTLSRGILFAFSGIW